MDIEKALKDEIDSIFASDYTPDEVEKIIHRTRRKVSGDAFLIVKSGGETVSILLSRIDGVYRISMEMTSFLLRDKKLERGGKIYRLYEHLSSLSEMQEKYLILFETENKEAKFLICDELLGRTSLPVEFEENNVTFLIRLKCLF
ncbi:MAG: hypothetical protein J7J16_05120 [Deltaproteobacteria bacterium]|nr:hypothetical protein [Deltaproteobacteria bacterium]